MGPVDIFSLAAALFAGAVGVITIQISLNAPTLSRMLIGIGLSAGCFLMVALNVYFLFDGVAR